MERSARTPFRFDLACGAGATAAVMRPRTADRRVSRRGREVCVRGVIWDGERLIVTDKLSVRAPGPGEVRVRVLRSGVCHSDLNMMESSFVGTPVILGHEAAGVVEALGPDVR